MVVTYSEMQIYGKLIVNICQVDTPIRYGGTTYFHFNFILLIIHLGSWGLFCIKNNIYKYNI